MQDFMNQGGDVNYQEKIDSLQEQINAEIAKLDSQLEIILEQHEKNFLTAYRVSSATQSRN